MRAVILAGGEGKRLRPLTESVPKALLPVNSKPILQFIIEQLQREGFEDIHIAIGYKGEMIESYFDDGSSFGVNIYYSWEQQPLGTAGPLRLVNLPADETVLTMNGDLLTEASLRDIYAFHQKHNPVLTVCSVSQPVQVEYGVLETENGRVLGITEKPQLDFDVFAGIAVLGPEAIDCIPVGKPYQMTDLIEHLCENGSQVLVYPIKRHWLDIGHLEEYERANEVLYGRSAGRKSMMTSAEEADSGEEASGETGKGAALPAVVAVE